MKTKKLLIYSALLCCTLAGMSGCKKKKSERELDLRNLYFSSWDGSDPYTDVIEKMFDVEITPSSYSNQDWGEKVSSEVNGNNIGDAFHFDLESFNFGNTYKNWAEGKIIKALPDDLSKWPKIKALIENTSNIESLKLGGKIYGLPLAYNQDDPDKTISNFTYVYRRDWLRTMKPAWVHEDDVYTWQEFLDIIDLFATRPAVVAGDAAAIGDVNWGFPSLTNFFKDSPHCYSAPESGPAVNASNASQDAAGYNAYKGGTLGIYYENLSLSNYSKLRQDIKNIKEISEEDLDDMTAIMRVKGPDGKFHLEGSENWFSMTFFNYDITDAKQEKILDILEYLLGEEGTRLAILGKENQDYRWDGEDTELIPDNWPMKSNGEYVTKINGAKYLRQMITLNNDAALMDPYTNLKCYQIIKKWQDDMKAAKANGELVTFQEPANVKWLSTQLKDLNTSSLIKEGNDNALSFCYGSEGFGSLEAYTAKFNTAKWNDTIAEINRVLGR